MNSREFCYWLQGVFEVANPKTLDENQVDLIKRHLNMVFIHEIDGSYPVEQQAALNEAHNELPIKTGVETSIKTLTPDELSKLNYPKGMRC